MVELRDELHRDDPVVLIKFVYSDTTTGEPIDYYFRKDYNKYNMWQPVNITPYGELRRFPSFFNMNDKYRTVDDVVKVIRKFIKQKKNYKKHIEDFKKRTRITKKSKFNTRQIGKRLQKKIREVGLENLTPQYIKWLKALKDEANGKATRRKYRKIWQEFVEKTGYEDN